MHRNTHDPTGYALVIDLPPINANKKRIEIEQMIVSPRMQKRGIGNSFLKELMAKYTGDKILVRCRAQSVTAIKFFKDRGFKEVRKNNANTLLEYEHNRPPEEK
jgi:N-acetylglutamate synthase-like GNAT family acetyltransferase